VSAPRPGGGVPDPVRFCVMTTVALLAWGLGPAVMVVAMSALGLWAYRKAVRAGLTESRCVLKRPRLVLGYLGLALVGGLAGIFHLVRH
jgi:hypothetical protein